MILIFKVTNISRRKIMDRIKILDVTLRDGGCVNNFDFGTSYMNSILNALEKSEVDYIELGYIDEKNGSECARTQYIDEKVVYKNFLKNKKKGRKYVCMVDYGKFDVSNLEDRNENSIDGIRMAFHKKNWRDVIALGRIIIDKGYEFFIQPMLTMRYSDKELIELVECINSELPDATGFYIVDSFGEMRGNDVIRLMHLVDNNLVPSMILGFHSHNNLQLSYSNAMELLKFPTNRMLMLDSSVMGMGKGAGNLNTELILEHLNLYYDKKYQMAPLMELIDQVINVIHKDLYWGYAAEYYLSSINRCTPSYASHFYNKHMLPIDQVAELLSMVAEDKKISFDKNYAEELYLKYNAEKNIDDTQTISELKKKFENKKVLMIAPGKSILHKRNDIECLINDKDVISVSLNNFEFSTDYYLITRADMLDDAINYNKNVIVPSNIHTDSSENINVINYKNWIVKEDKTYDSSGVIGLNLIKDMNPKEINLAGFDGFSSNINENYYKKEMRKPVSEEQADNRNKFYKRYIESVGNKVPVSFVTPSMYN